MANLFLYHYENKFIKELKETDRVAAWKFGHMPQKIKHQDQKTSYEHHINPIK